ncbi:MAG: hypothetical protein Q7T74_03705 [Candidatus Saccharibacteria bacterium]|nr:hypothetical protein [Candidatus Saccharibacteria bacterium]
MANTISYPTSYNHTRNLIEQPLSIQHETEAHTFDVSEMDSQTAGDNTKYNVTQAVIDQVQNINLSKEASDTTKFIVAYGRTLARSQ